MVEVRVGVNGLVGGVFVTWLGISQCSLVHLM